MDKKILIVDDDPNVRDVLETLLIRDGYLVLKAENCHDAIDLTQTHSPDLILLDVVLPDGDGLELCRNIRMKSNVPIVFISSKDEDIDKISGLVIGGDDYITKPFNPHEVSARIKVILRRSHKVSNQQQNTIISYDNLQINLLNKELIIEGTPIELTLKEFNILALLAKHPNQVFSKEQLYENVWKDKYGYMDTVTVHIKRLREKIEKDPSNPRYVKTVRGVGYKFQP